MTNNLFANNMEIKNLGGANQLSVTAQLNAVASNFAGQVLQVVLADEEQYADQVLASQTNHDEMDRLIESVINLQEEADIEFLQSTNEQELERVLKSQQSKRSRAKSQTMTVDNYSKMMTAAIAEALVRLALGKPKGAGGGANGGDPTYSDEELRALAEDPGALARAIRNVQSKKSIAKSKVDFDPNGERWMSLLAAEQQLKDLRASVSGTQSTKAKEAIQTVEVLGTVVGDLEVDKLDETEAKEMLAKLQEALASRQ